MIRKLLLAGAMLLGAGAKAGTPERMWTADGAPVQVGELKATDGPSRYCEAHIAGNGITFLIDRLDTGGRLLGLLQPRNLLLDNQIIRVRIDGSPYLFRTSSTNDGYTIWLQPVQPANNASLVADWKAYVTRFLQAIYSSQQMQLEATYSNGNAASFAFFLRGVAAGYAALDRCGAAILATQSVPAAPPVARSTPAAKSTVVPLQPDGMGGWHIQVSLNGNPPETFLLDSGASDVSIPQSMAQRLRAQGTLTDADFVRMVVVILADGRRVRSPVYQLRSLTVGDCVLYHVEVDIIPDGSTPLLRQSVLQRFHSWSVDNAGRTLHLSGAT